MPDWKKITEWGSAPSGLMPRVVVILTLLILIVIVLATIGAARSEEEADDAARFEARLARLRGVAEQRAGQPSDCYALKGALILSSLVSVVALLILADCAWKARFDAEMRSLVAKRGEFRSSNPESPS